MEWVLSITIIFLCYLFCFTNGFNDAANIIALPVVTRVISPFLGLFLACIFEFIGCYFLGELVLKTILKDIIDFSFLQSNLYKFLFSILFVASSWGIVCTILGFPISSSHTLIGALLGGAIGAKGFYVIKWINILKIVLFLILAPILSLFFCYLLTKIVYFIFLNSDKKVSKFFEVLQIFSLCFFALAHGSNNGKKIVGLFYFCLLVLGFYKAEEVLPQWVLLSCAIVISCGVFLGGKNVIKTVGMKIYKLKQWQAAISQFGSSLLLYLGSCLGIPLSSTHLIVGSVIGSGLSYKTKCVRWNFGLGIFLVWILTLPLSVILSYFVFNIVKFL
ncbi:MAG: inorganic phosphate transporter [Endomicrobiia bacterium]